MQRIAVDLPSSTILSGQWASVEVRWMGSSYGLLFPPARLRITLIVVVVYFGAAKAAGQQKEKKTEETEPAYAPRQSIRLGDS